MKKLLAIGVLALVFACLFAGRLQAATRTVTATDFSFDPKTVIINAGDTVLWINNGMSIHTVTSGTNCVWDDLWDTPYMSPGQNAGLSFETPGTYPYFCSYHCLSLGMTGKVVVIAGSPLSAPAGQQIFFFNAVDAPVAAAEKSASSPIGIGPLAAGGTTFTLGVALAPYVTPVDIYVALAVLSDPLNIYFVRPDLSSQTISLNDLNQAFLMGVMPPDIAPWATDAGVGAALLKDVPVSMILSGQYALYLLVTPSGGSLSDFDLFWTSVTVP